MLGSVALRQSVASQREAFFERVTPESLPVERILIVSDAWLPQINGVVRTYQNISSQLSAIGCDVTVISPADFPNTAMPTYPDIRLAPPLFGRLARLI